MASNIKLDLNYSARHLHRNQTLKLSIVSSANNYNVIICNINIRMTSCYANATRARVTGCLLLLYRVYAMKNMMFSAIFILFASRVVVASPVGVKCVYLLGRNANVINTKRC